MVLRSCGAVARYRYEMKIRGEDTAARGDGAVYVSSNVSTFRHGNVLESHAQIENV